jgi:hypothetical protein
VAHVGDELRLVLARDLELAALLGDLIKQARVLRRNGRLVGKALHQGDDGPGKLARCAPLKNQCAKRTIAAEQRHNECCAKPDLDGGIAQWVTGSV